MQNITISKRKATYNCCKDCEKRYVGCHGSCEDYLAIKKINDEFNNGMRQIHENNNKDIDYIKKSMKRHKRSMKERIER